MEVDQSLSSSSSDIRDWEFIDTDSMIVKKSELNDDEEVENPTENLPSPSGLFLHENTPHHSRVEELIINKEHLHHNESNSSSDIDVIDECPEEGQNNLAIQSMDISFCSSEIGSTMSVSERDQTSEISTSSTVIENRSTDTQTTPEPVATRRFSFFSIVENIIATIKFVLDAISLFHGERGHSAKDYFIIGFIVSLCMVLPYANIALFKAYYQESKIGEMEAHVNHLIRENEHLRNKVWERIESGKLFGNLDEEMRNIKSENAKLQEAMQTVIHQLMKQTHTIKEGLEKKEDAHHKDPYKKEIAKLKEQINMMRMDNVELQKLVAQLRYSKHFSHDDINDKQVKKEKRNKYSEETFGFKKNRQGEVNGNLEEVHVIGKIREHFEEKGMNEKVDQFIEDYTKWNEKISELKKAWELKENYQDEHDHYKQLMETMTKYKGEVPKKEQVINQKEESRYEKKSEGESRYEKKSEGESRYEKNSEGESKYEKKSEDETSNNRKYKNRKFYNWSWKDFHKNVKGTLKNFPNMFSEYVLIDKEKVNGVLETISHYYKKAQDKTKKILESYTVDKKTEAVKHDIWTLLGEMKNKWVEMKNEFMESHFGDADSEEDKAESIKSSAFSEKTKPSIPTEEEQHTDKKQTVSDVFKDQLVEFLRALKETDSNLSKASEMLTEDPEGKNAIEEIREKYFSNLNPEQIKKLDELEQLFKRAGWSIFSIEPEIILEFINKYNDKEFLKAQWLFMRAQHRAELRENKEK